LGARALGAPPDDRVKTLGATRTPRPPHIDGRLDDAVWALATSDGRFTQNFPEEGAAPSERTVVRVLYDNDAIYLGIRCFDDHPREVVERLTRRDRDTQADKVTVDISSKNDRLTAYHFDLNVAGVLLDGVRFNDTDYSGDWDGLWDGRSHRDEQGWTAELRIPLRTLRYDGSTTAFGLQVRRVIQRRNETDEWAYVPRTARGEVSYYGKLVGLDGLHARRLVQIVPYLAGRLTFLGNQPPLDGVYPSASMGADLKVGLTPALTLDATFNPDFGQVEADQVVLNLTTFEVQFPEKRPFFLEGAELFATPFQLFYSRRIGRAPPSPSLAANEQLAQPLPDGQIWLAGKITGLVGKRLTVAALDALTAERTVQISSGTGVRPRLVEPFTNFAVLRLKKEFWSSSQVGVTVTGVTRAEPAHFAAPDPGLTCPDGSTPTAAGRCTHDAYTAGADVNLKTRDGTWGGAAHVVGSVLVDGPTRTVPDGTTLGPGSTGVGIWSEVGKYGGKHWLFRLNYQGMSPGLDFNDAGYLQRANLHHAHAIVDLRTKTPHGAMVEGGLEAFLGFEQSWDGAALARVVDLSGYMLFRNFWTLSVDCSFAMAHQDNRESRDGAFLERIEGGFCGIFGRTDPRARVVLSAWSGMGNTQRGLGFDTNATLSLRIIPPLEIDIIPHGNMTYGDPRWFDTVLNGPTDGPRTYYFGDLDSRTFDVTLRGTWAFTPTLTLQAYAQLFLASGHYGPTWAIAASGSHPVLPVVGNAGWLPTTQTPDGSPDFREGTINVNVVMRWEYTPGAAIIGVWTHSSNQRTYDPTLEGIGRLRLNKFNDGPTTDVLLIKISALWG
jgi:hypothetical protein